MGAPAHVLIDRPGDRWRARGSGGPTRLVILALAFGSLACEGSSAPPPGAVLWLSADSLGAEAGTYVEAWPDASGYGHDVAVVPFPPGIRPSGDPPDRRPRLTPPEEGLAGHSVARFDGADDLLGIADADLLNVGGPYGRRTIFLAFRTGVDVRRRQMLFETGGDLRGFNVYLDEGVLRLGVYNLWNDDRGSTTPFGPLTIFAPIRPGTGYLVTLELDQPRGLLRGWLNERPIGSVAGAGRVFVHHEDIGIGAINEDTYYHDGVRQGVPTGDFFAGDVAEILVYNDVLTDRARRATERYLGGKYGLGRQSSPAAPDSGSRLYAASGITDEILRLDPADGSRTGTVDVDRRRGEVDEPHGVAVGPEGLHWYATLSHGEPTLWKFELAGDRLVGRVRLPTAGAARIGITPDGKRAFIPDYDRSRPGHPGKVAVVGLADLSIEATLSPCAGPHHAAPDPTGRLVAVACSLSDEVVILDARTLEEVRRFPVDESPGPPGAPGFKPLNLAWSTDGATLYVAMHLTDAIRAFDRDGNVVGTVTVGDGPAQIAVSPDGRTLVSANRRDGSLSVVAVPDLIEQKRVALDTARPHGVALDTAGATAFVTCEGTPESRARVVAVDLEAGRVKWTADGGGYALGIAYAAGPR